jgi:hypothetical protein
LSKVLKIQSNEKLKKTNSEEKIKAKIENKKKPSYLRTVNEKFKTQNKSLKFFRNSNKAIS